MTEFIEKLITSLRTAVENEGVLDKEPTSYDDVFDAFRLAMLFYRLSEYQLGIDNYNIRIRCVLGYAFHTILNIQHHRYQDIGDSYSFGTIVDIHISLLAVVVLLAAVLLAVLAVTVLLLFSFGCCCYCVLLYFRTCLMQKLSSSLISISSIALCLL
jgi:hypothetical protein